MTKGYIPIFSTKIRKYLIVKKATIDEVTKPIINVDILIFAWYRAKSAIKKTSAPSIVGIAKRKANFEESFKFKPIKRAAVIAVPDLDAPGSKAKTWKTPINNAPIIVSSTMVFDEDAYLYATSSNPANRRFIYAMFSILVLFDSIKSEPNRPTRTIGKVAIIKSWVSLLLSLNRTSEMNIDLAMSKRSDLK